MLGRAQPARLCADGSPIAGKDGTKVIALRSDASQVSGGAPRARLTDPVVSVLD